MMDELERHGAVSGPLALTAALDTTPAIGWHATAHGSIIIPTGSSISLLTFYAAEKLDGTYLPCYTNAGAAITLSITAARSYELPAGLFGVCFMKIVATDAAAADRVYLCKKG